MNWAVLMVAITLVCKLGQCAPFTSESDATAILARPDSSTITDDLKDIMHLISKDLLKNITEQHLQSDEEFKAAVIYMQSDEWKERVVIIRNKPEWIALKLYLKEMGIDVDRFIKCLESFVGTITVTQQSNISPANKSLKAFLIDIEQNLPTVKILTTLHEQMLKNNNFQELFEKLSSKETYKLLEGVLALPEVRDLLKDFETMELNLSGALSLMYTFFGWGELKLS